MRRSMMTVLVALMLGAAACGGSREENSPATVSAAIRQVDADFVAAFHAKDMDKLVRKMGDTWLFQQTIWSSDLPKPVG